MAPDAVLGQKKGPQPDPKDERARQIKKELDDVMESDAFQGLVAEVAKDARVMSELKANPKGLLQRKGIRIPEGVDVRFAGESAPRQKRGPEQDPEDRERVSRLEKELDDITASGAFQGLIAEAAKDKRAMSELKANPKGLLKRKGIRIPDVVDVKFSTESYCVCFYYPVIHCYCYWWCCYCYTHWHRYCWCW